MNIRIFRIILAAIAIELASIALLVVVVAVFGPRDMAAAQKFAENTGFWLGPVCGVVFCFLGGYLVARRLPDRQMIHGLLVGVATAAIDVALLIVGGASFQLIFLVSNAGRVLAGAAGGWLACRRGKSMAATSPKEA